MFFNPISRHLTDESYSFQFKILQEYSIFMHTLRNYTLFTKLLINNKLKKKSTDACIDDATDIFTMSI